MLSHLEYGLSLQVAWWPEWAEAGLTFWSVNFSISLITGSCYIVRRSPPSPTWNVPGIYEYCLCLRDIIGCTDRGPHGRYLWMEMVFRDSNSAYCDFYNDCGFSSPFTCSRDLSRAHERETQTNRLLGLFTFSIS